MGNAAIQELSEEEFPSLEGLVREEVMDGEPSIPYSASFESAVASLPDELVQKIALEGYAHAMEPIQKETPSGLRRMVGSFVMKADLAITAFKEGSSPLLFAKERAYDKILNPERIPRSYERAVRIASYFQLGDEYLLPAAESLLQSYTNEIPFFYPLLKFAGEFEELGVPRELLKPKVEKWVQFIVSVRPEEAKEVAEEYELGDEVMSRIVQEEYCQSRYDGRNERVSALAETFPEYLS